MVRGVEGGPGTGKDITGCSAQGFGTELVIIKNFILLYLNLNLNLNLFIFLENDHSRRRRRNTEHRRPLRH